ncbi:hypothetical protein EYF80_034021 [Liparis tanakae]|uniref:Uncharacterized protein n=1 Tax=Liparis tanakae TaxID=230148 RepID=A0A4Z2GSL8_9TELE|nr:hypothetical protein EYF80_034021 [Liparis tanakae]
MEWYITPPEGSEMRGWRNEPLGEGVGCLAPLCTGLEEVPVLMSSEAKMSAARSPRTFILDNKHSSGAPGERSNGGL